MTDDQADLPDNTPDADGFTDESSPAAEGILRCLQMLAEEAAALQLPRTLAALDRAMATCTTEAADVTDAHAGFGEVIRPPDATLH